MKNDTCITCIYHLDPIDPLFSDDETLRCAVYPSGPASSFCLDYSTDDWALSPEEFIDRHIGRVRDVLCSDSLDRADWTVNLLTFDTLRRLQQHAVEHALGQGTDVPFSVLRHFMSHSQIVWRHVQTILNQLEQLS